MFYLTKTTLFSALFLFAVISCSSQDPVSPASSEDSSLVSTLGDSVSHVTEDIDSVSNDSLNQIPDTHQDSREVTDTTSQTIDETVAPDRNFDFSQESIHAGKSVDIWQRHAMLNKGVNYSNWLEQSRIWPGSVWEYDEEDVRITAELGFESLRLPVDFENYFFAGSFDYTDWEYDSVIFAVVDSFVVWTGRHGISLTIDQHSYSDHLTLEATRDPDYIERLKFMWQKIAYHYRDAREDVFFELYNEPDQAIPFMRWWDICNEIITAIREVNQYHTVIVGGTDWYNIRNLTFRPPQMDDDNTIYAFHIYDPFLFTHQGATWTGMATIHSIPFPYDPDLMPEDYEAAGIDPASSGHNWLRTQFDNYETIGSREHVDSLVAVAANWGVEHDVPVICNEFGANSPGNTPEWRASYYTVMIEIFENHNIPWQHWEWNQGFTIFDANGAGVDNILPGFRDAFQLDN